MLAAAIAGVSARSSDAVEDAARPGSSSRGSLTWAFRIGLATLAVAVLVLAGLPYLSLQIQNSALALSRNDPLGGAQRAASAARLVPGDSEPWSTEATICTRAAQKAEASAREDRAGAALDDLALALGAQEKAVWRDPADWANYYRAAWAALDLLVAKGYSEGNGARIAEAGISRYAAGGHDWSGLAGPEAVPEVGAAADSLAEDAAGKAAARRYRDLTSKQLCDLASDFLGSAARLNPLDTAVERAVELVEKLRAIA
jgi:hypothetical protein